MAVINRFPYSSGHVMVAPFRHAGNFDRLPDDALLEIWRMTDLLRKAIDRTLHPHGYNVGINLGRSAGAGVLGHIHVHLVPRWQGDTNFMPVVAGTKVIPLSLDDLYRKLVRALRTERSKFATLRPASPRLRKKNGKDADPPSRRTKSARNFPDRRLDPRGRSFRSPRRHKGRKNSSGIRNFAPR